MGGTRAVAARRGARCRAAVLTLPPPPPLSQFLVLPLHDSLGDFIDSYAAADHGQGPLVALRSSSAWTMFNLSAARGDPNVADLNVTHFATLRLDRGPAEGREKYLFNASAVEPAGAAPPWRAGARVHNVNLHGVYHVQAVEGAHVNILQADARRWPAYHLHLLNTRAPERVHDGRHLFFPAHPVQDTAVGDFVRRAIVRRQRETRKEAEGGARARPRE